MNKLSLALISSSILSAATLLIGCLDRPAMAIGKNIQQNILQQSLVSNFSSHFTCDRPECIGKYRSAVTKQVATQKSIPSAPTDPIQLNFTEEESDAAIAKFGCDCPRSINLLRQTRGITVGVEGEYLPPSQSVGYPH
jgi:hypothetical protein